MFSLLGAWVQLLVGELRSYKLCSAAKEKKKKEEMYLKKKKKKEVPGCLVVRTPRFYCCGTGFGPWLGN